MFASIRLKREIFSVFYILGGQHVFWWWIWKREKKKENETKKRWQESEKLRIEENNKLLQISSDLPDDERAIFVKIIEGFKQSIKYRLTETDTELIMQFCQLKIMRDKRGVNTTKIQRDIFG